MVARGILSTPDLFEGRIGLQTTWHIFKDIGMSIENEMVLGQATLITLPEGEERAKVLSSMQKIIHPDTISPFEALIKKYKDLLPHASGEQMQIRMMKE